MLLLGGIAPELLVRLLASELGYLVDTVRRSRCLSPLPEQLLSQNDAGFAVRVMQTRRRPWPQIFPQDYYRDEQGGLRDRGRPWAMGGGAPIKVAGSDPLVGCNFFLQRCRVIA